MNILYIVPYPPSLVRVRPFQIIQALARRGHRISVLTLYTGRREQEDVRALAAGGLHVRAFPLSRARSVINSGVALLAGEPMQSRFSWHPALKAEIRKFIRPQRWPEEAIDIVQVEHLRGVHFGLAALALQKKAGQKLFGSAIPVFWDSVDCISALFEQASVQAPSAKSRWLARLELPRTRAFEARAARKFERVLVTSPADRAAFQALGGEQFIPERFCVIPNGVDLDYFQPGPEEGRDPLTLLVSGKMSYHANAAMVIHLVEKILPLVREEIPAVKLVIAGQNPPPEIMKMAALPGVTVTGYLADLRPCLQGAAVAAAPLVYGAGIQNKVLEAMACGTPVVTTSQAAGALTARPGEEILVAGDEADFARVLVGLFRSPEHRCSLGRAGRAYVERNHSWDQIATSLEEIYHHSLDTALKPRQPASYLHPG